MIPVFVERIVRPQPNGSGYQPLEQAYREVLAEGREVRIEAGRRAEFRVPQGSRVVVYVIEGTVRFEGDDTAANPGEIVWFKASGEPDAVLGMQADMAFRGTLVFGAPATH